MKSFPKWLLILITMPRLALFGALSCHPDLAIKTDSTQYLILATNMVSSHRFSTSSSAPFSPETMRTPGYPLFIVPFVKLTANVVLWIVAMQMGIGLWTCWIVWKWALPWGHRRAAMATTWILGLDWILMIHSTLILTETLFIFIFTLALIESWKSLEEDPARSFYAGMLWGVSALIRPIVFYLPVFLSLLWYRQRKWGLCFLLASYLLPGLWVLRNVRVAQFAGFTSIDGIAFLLYPAAGVESIRTHRPLAEVRSRLREEAIRNVPANGSDVDFRNAYRQKAMSILHAYPKLLTIYCFHGALRILGGTGLEMLTDLLDLPPPDSNMLQETPLIKSSGTLLLLKKYPALIPLQIIYCMALVWMYVTALSGLVRLWKNGYSQVALLLLITFLYILGISSHQGYYRFRIPLIPILAMGIAAYFAPSLKRSRSL